VAQIGKTFISFRKEPISLLLYLEKHTHRNPSASILAGTFKITSVLAEFFLLSHLSLINGTVRSAKERKDRRQNEQISGPLYEISSVSSIIPLRRFSSQMKF